MGSKRRRNSLTCRTRRRPDARSTASMQSIDAAVDHSASVAPFDSRWPTRWRAMSALPLPALAPAGPVEVKV